MLLIPRRCALAAALSFLSLPSFAQTTRPSPQPEARLNPVVVLSAQEGLPVSQALSGTSIWTADDLARSPARGLLDLLQASAGVEIGRNGSRGTLSSIFLRGQESKSVAVFLDGLRLPTDGIGAVQLLDLPLEAIERIEVVRGPQSALYGEGAIGGVILIQTRQTADSAQPSVVLSTELGSRGSRLASATLQQAWRQPQGTSTQVLAVLSHENLANPSAIRPGSRPFVNPDRDPFEALTGLMSLQTRLQGGQQISLQARRTQQTVGIDDFFGSAGAELADRQFETRQTQGGLSLRQPLTAEAELIAGLQASTLDYRDLRNGQPLSFGGEAGGTQQEQSLSILQGKGPTRLRLDLERRSSSYDAFGSAFDRGQLGLGGSVRHAVERLDLELAVRRDRIQTDQAGRESQKDISSLSMGLGYALSPGWRLTGLASTGFRSPAPSELFGFGGNPALEPEEHRGLEFGLGWTDERTRLRLTHFDSKTQNAIVFTSGTYANLPQAENRGVELSLQHRLSQWPALRLGLDLTAQDPRNSLTGEPLARRARRFGSISAGLDLARTRVEARLLASSERPEGGVMLAGYSVLSLQVAHDLSPSVELSLRLENALDRDYELARSYSVPQQAVFVGARVRF